MTENRRRCRRWLAWTWGTLRTRTRDGNEGRAGFRGSRSAKSLSPEHRHRRRKPIRAALALSIAPGSGCRSLRRTRNRAAAWVDIRLDAPGAFPYETKPMAASFAALILAAGKGTRMRSARPKVLHELAGRPMIAHVLGAVAALKPQHMAVVIAPNQNDVAAAVAPADFVIQRQAKGTGSAVAAAKSLLGRYAGDILIVAGDAPLVTRETFKPLFDARKRHPDAAVIVLGMRLADGGSYGRLILADDGSLARIVEAGDCSEEERAIDFVSSGVMLAKAPVLFDLVGQLGAHNAQGEQYLTDIIGLARAKGLICRTAEGDPAQLLGVNSRDELAYAEAVMQQRLR